MFAGRSDAMGLTALASSMFFLTPWTAGTLPVWPAGVAAFIGAGTLSWSRLKRFLIYKDELASEGFVLPSDDVPPLAEKEAGLKFGLTTDYHKTMSVENDLLARHTAIIGQSGVGKTTLGEYLLWQQTVRRGGWLFVDAKIDRDTRNHLAYMAKVTGREDELYMLDISAPDDSNSINPILHGDPDEVASRLLNLIPSSESSPGADYYRQSANHALVVIIAALKASNRLYHFGDLSIIMQSGKALDMLERMTPEGPEKRALTIFLDQFRKVSKTGTFIDVERLKVVIGGMAGRIALFAQGKFGKVFNVYNPEIVLTDLILQNKMLYVSLPTMGKDTAALNLGKMIISDLRSAVASIQDMPKSVRPDVPFIALLDEMGAYVMEGVARLFEQARSAGISLFPAFQSFSQLNRVSPDFADIIIQNTWNKVFFKFGAYDSSEMASEILGKTTRYQKTISVSGSQSSSAQALRTTPEANMSDGGGVGESWREMEESRVTPDKLRSLGKGEAFMISGAKVFHLKTPMLNFPKDIEPYQVCHHKVGIEAGKRPLHYEARLKEFLIPRDAKKEEDKPKEVEIEATEKISLD